MSEKVLETSLKWIVPPQVPLTQSPSIIYHPNSQAGKRVACCYCCTICVSPLVLMCLPGILKKDLSSHSLSGQGWKLDPGNLIWWSLGTLTVPLTCQRHASLCTFNHPFAMMLSLLPCSFPIPQYRMPNVQYPTSLNNSRWNTTAGTLAQGFLQITASSSFLTNPNPLFFI